MKTVEKKDVTKLIRIDAGLHKLLKILASKKGISIKELIETQLSELLSIA